MDLLRHELSDEALDRGSLRLALGLWADLSKMKPAASATMDAKFRFVFSQRRAMRLKRLILPTACSMRGSALV